MSRKIAIVGMACCFPDAFCPDELWEMVLAKRRAFRRIPQQRLCAGDYFSPDRSCPDRTYVTQAAVLEGYEFDRLHFRISSSSFRAAGLAHWLALDVASKALQDAGFPDGQGLPRDSTGVLLGNTLTDEFTRAELMRLRWPYVRRVVEAVLLNREQSSRQSQQFLNDLEGCYKAPFAPVEDESLAGGLSNTIAGRICNHFDLRGAGYTIDGACASSLLATSNGCAALLAGDLDVVLVGGVDLSMDPFELVGFSKIGALAPITMRVYDRHSAGFWPGEGCGVVVLMRHEDAVAQGKRIYAHICGWGVSSDGSGGLTRPEVGGQLLAIRRAYRQAGFGVDTITYFEGHGTGTAVGDTTELKALSQAHREAIGETGTTGLPAVIGTIKANIGHTKAAAGVAGLIKAALVVHEQVLPPTTGCQEPHEQLTRAKPALRVLRSAEPWPADRPLRAAVSSMGFGGINAHLVLEGSTTKRRRKFQMREIKLTRSAQDAELFLFSGAAQGELLQQIEHVFAYADKLSFSELTDLAAELQRRFEEKKLRAAAVASTPSELAERLNVLASHVRSGQDVWLDVKGGVFFGGGGNPPRIGLLFPGQASQVYFDAGALGVRFDVIHNLYTRSALANATDPTATEVVQPAIMTASKAGLLVLDLLGISACVAVGHSIGELAALHWAGAFDEDALLRIARKRGALMAKYAVADGAMAVIFAGSSQVKALTNGEPVVICGFNAPSITAISGSEPAIRTVTQRAQSRGLRTKLLPVSHAFHSPLMAPVAPPFSKMLAAELFRRLQREVVSTITGQQLNPDEDLRRLLVLQLTEPVRFTDALAVADPKVDFWIETGSGHVLTGLVQKNSDTPVVALDAGGPSMKGLLNAVGASFVLGSPVNHQALFDDRFTRSFDLNWSPSFFTNPCELAPESDGMVAFHDMKSDAPTESTPIPTVTNGSADALLAEKYTPLETVRRLVAQYVELPLEMIQGDHSLLSDLHLNSIRIGELAAEAARQLGLAAPQAPTEYAQATVAQLAQALEELQRAGPSSHSQENGAPPEGIDAWIRSYQVEWMERPLPPDLGTTPPGTWQVIASPGHPLTETLQDEFHHSVHGGNVVVCLPRQPDDRCINLLLQAARIAQRQTGQTCFVLVQEESVGTGFAKTLYIESPHVTTCVVNIPFDHPEAGKWVVAEAAAVTGFSEARYDRSGRRTVPVWQLWPMDAPAKSFPVGSQDVLLVTGGGKGIAAECAMELARKSGVRLLLMGRSDPNENQELKSNLDRMAAAGIHVRYVRADVTDSQAVRAAIEQGERELGPVTAIIHGAGINVPQLISALDEQSVLNTLAPKLHGARNVLAAIDPDRLRLLVVFSSIIGRMGLAGEADYALANEWLTGVTERFQTEHPACRCLALEWSVWSGVGMGQRLGRVDALMNQGVTPISPDQGIAVLCQLVSCPPPGAAVVVTGRFGMPPTVELDTGELPVSRFLAPPRVYYPGVELVLDLELSRKTDPYVDEHVLHGQRLFPLVMVLEAMTQVAMVLVGTKKLPVVQDMACSRAIVVPSQGTRTIRLAALVRSQGTVEVALRSDETDFQIDHFRATCTFNEPVAKTVVPSEAIDVAKPTETTKPLALNPEQDLYKNLLFHRGRFRRLRAYRKLRATECLADLTPEDSKRWFAPRLPDTVVLPDPAGRDAGIHAIQACIPHCRLLPIGADRIAIRSETATGLRSVHARERYRDGDLFVYDLELIGEDGTLQEIWNGLRLKKVEAIPTKTPWVVSLLSSYLERRLQELIPNAKLTVALRYEDKQPCRARSEVAIQQALGKPVTILQRPDGKPETLTEQSVSAAHAGQVTLAVCALGQVGCDLEPVVSRSEATWRDLLGTQKMQLAEIIAREQAENIDCAATRVWGVLEGVKKAGFATDAPLVFASRQNDGWVMLESGSLAAASYLTRVRGMDARLAVAVVVASAGRTLSHVDGYHYSHVVGFEETNVVGNVYYTNYLLWQGRCREAFLREKTPEILQLMKTGLHLATTRCSCEYFTELKAFDEVDVHMRLKCLQREYIELDFEYWRANGGQKQLVARGQQQIACILPNGTRAVPDILSTALAPYATKPH